MPSDQLAWPKRFCRSCDAPVGESSSLQVRPVISYWARFIRMKLSRLNGLIGAFPRSCCSSRYDTLLNVEIRCHCFERWTAPRDEKMGSYCSLHRTLILQVICVKWFMISIISNIYMDRSFYPIFKLQNQYHQWAIFWKPPTQLGWVVRRNPLWLWLRILPLPWGNFKGNT